MGGESWYVILIQVFNEPGQISFTVVNSLFLGADWIEALVLYCARLFFSGIIWLEVPFATSESCNLQKGYNL